MQILTLLSWRCLVLTRSGTFLYSGPTTLTQLQPSLLSPLFWGTMFLLLIRNRNFQVSKLHRNRRNCLLRFLHAVGVSLLNLPDARYKLQHNVQSAIGPRFQGTGYFVRLSFNYVILV
jgi:hypothetical protein